MVALMSQSALRVARHTLTRAVVLFITVVIAVYITILVANMGGYVDEIRKAEITFGVAMAVYGNPEYQLLPPAQLRAIVDERAELQFRIQGLDRPFIVRSFEYLWNALSLDLGRSEQIQSDRGSRLVRNVLLDRLPATLLLFGTTDLILFFFAVSSALFLSRRYGSLLDRAVIALAPTSSAPGWFYGIFLILIFAAVLRVLPWGRMYAAPRPEGFALVLSVLRHMVLPVSAMTLGSLFASIYSWRTFFLIYSSEDYVELARAKGLSSQAIERRYILRPTLPTIITSFLLMIITMWMGAIVLETVFNWPGLGRLMYQAIQLNDTPVVVGSVVIYAYLLAASVLLLDFIYVLIDPRVRVGGGRRG